MFILLSRANSNAQWMVAIHQLQLSYQCMFKLFTLSPLFAFATEASPLSKYVIKQGAYLLQAPPKRPVSPYALFVKDQFSKKKSLKVATAGSQLAKKWELYPELKEKFTKLAQERSSGYEQRKQQYEKKYVIPFKNVTVPALRLQKLFAENKIPYKGKNIREIGNLVKQKISEHRTLQDDKKLQEEADRLKAERNTLKLQFLFPALPWPTFKAYKLRNSLPQAQRPPTYEEDLKAGYEAEVKKWKENVQKWLLERKYDISIDDFVKLYEKDLKDKKKKKAAKEEEDEDSSDY